MLRAHLWTPRLEPARPRTCTRARPPIRVSSALQQPAISQFPHTALQLPATTTFARLLLHLVVNSHMYIYVFY